MPGNQWNAEADRDLLLAIIDEGALKGIAWANIAATLNQKGYTFTMEACRQRFQKIRKESRTSIGSAGGTPRKGNESTTAIPRKRGPAAGVARTGSSKKGPMKNMPTLTNNVFEDDDEEDSFKQDYTPSKKRKRTGKREESDEENQYNEQNATSFKMELPGEVVDLEHHDLYDEEA